MLLRATIINSFRPVVSPQTFGLDRNWGAGLDLSGAELDCWLHRYLTIMTHECFFFFFFTPIIYFHIKGETPAAACSYLSTIMWPANDPTKIIITIKIGKKEGKKEKKKESESRRLVKAQGGKKSHPLGRTWFPTGQSLWTLKEKRKRKGWEKYVNTVEREEEV